MSADPWLPEPISHVDWMADAVCASDPERWVVFQRLKQAREVKRICLTQCPVLQQCRDHAAIHTWNGRVVVAGWMAPKEVPRRPPWVEQPVKWVCNPLDEPVKLLVNPDEEVPELMKYLERAARDYQRAQEKTSESRDRLIRAVNQAAREGVSEVRLADIVGVSRPTIRTWLGK